MGTILTILADYQTINVAEKGIAFTEQGFTQLQEEVIKSLDEATVKSFALGAAVVGGAAIGIYGFSKLKKKLESRKVEEA